jgi:hypothetical protein
MADFPLELWRIDGKNNRADPLLRRPDHDDSSDNNEGVVALPDSDTVVYPRLRVVRTKWA